MAIMMPMVLTVWLVLDVSVSSGCSLETYHEEWGNEQRSGGLIRLASSSDLPASSFETFQYSHKLAPMSCSWTVHVPRGKAIRISADTFFIPSQSGTEDCSDASVQIYDASVTPPIMHYELCGTHFEPIYRQWPKIIIKYMQSNGQSQRRQKSQFKLIWEIVDWPPPLQVSDAICGQDQFKCKITKMCISLKSVCNKIPDCVHVDIFDYSDESQDCIDPADQLKYNSLFSTNHGDFKLSSSNNVPTERRVVLIGSLLLLLIVLSTIVLTIYHRYRSLSSHHHIHIMQQTLRTLRMKFSTLTTATASATHQSGNLLEGESPPSYVAIQKNEEFVQLPSNVSSNHSYLYPKVNIGIDDPVVAALYTQNDDAHY